ncbi:hypothetical protein DVT68_01515 [Dyella solisilvae]|uniref:Uncharacterized protein n=1 Tax=Dyella solisilvae TaxID=1920168 RepID=A0A370KA92_9GAMM|nr:BcsR/BcsP family cellulose biosynthesis protein [Dyella solisilvae]RDI99558.1 hypothetical protein DVT68_01515 [Dyella solisilvae]
MNGAHGEQDMLPNDIDAYAQHVDGIDPARYLDSQAQEVWLAARRRWPLLDAVLHPTERRTSGS